MTLTYSQLGNNGRLGNQMFQYAALYGTAFLRGFNLAIPKDGHHLLDTFELTSDIIEDSTKADKTYQEPGFLYDLAIGTIDPNTELRGYFQSPYYFIHCEDRIREEFKFKSSIENKAKEIFAAIKDDRPTCSIHFRRTDYLDKSRYHHVQSSAYYNRCIQVILQNVPNAKFVCFSDDIEWCKDNLGDAFEFVHNSPAVDMAILAKCDMHIIANSSFSWWGAWLSKSQVVLTPAKWFGPAGPPDWQTIYCQGWHQVGD